MGKGCREVERGGMELDTHTHTHTHIQIHITHTHMYGQDRDLEDVNIPRVVMHHGLRSPLLGARSGIEEINQLFDEKGVANRREVQSV